jgi:hypothetical protein
MKTLLTATLLSFVIGTAAAFAQAPATPAAPAAPKPTRSAISVECSKQADAKGLHGPDRIKFRATCKKNGGKT